MVHLIDKDALVTELKNRIRDYWSDTENIMGIYPYALEEVIKYIDTLEVIDPYEQCIQYASIESGIKAHAEEYSFNIESELFNQLTKEHQALWRKEIEQACISGGYSGLNLARDPRYKENLKEVDLEKEIGNVWNPRFNLGWDDNSLVSINHKSFESIAKHFFELGLKAKGE